MVAGTNTFQTRNSYMILIFWIVTVIKSEFAENVLKGSHTNLMDILALGEIELSENLIYHPPYS